MMRGLFGLFALALVVTIAPASEPPVALLSGPPAALVPAGAEPEYDAKGACVSVRWKQWGGCGVCVATAGGKSLVLSCNHVFDATDSGALGAYPASCAVTAAGKRFDATAVSGETSADVAVLVVDGTLPVAEIADRMPEVGERVWRNGGGTGYQTGTVAPTDPSWVNESCKFFVSGRSESGDSGAGYFNTKNQLVAIHCGRGAGFARGTPISAAADKVPPGLFPRFRDRLEQRRKSVPVSAGGAPEPPAAKVTPAPCVCGDGCKCPAGACPGRCPVAPEPKSFRVPVSGDAVPYLSAGDCPNGRCPLPGSFGGYSAAGCSSGGCYGSAPAPQYRGVSGGCSGGSCSPRRAGWYPGKLLGR